MTVQAAQAVMLHMRDGNYHTMKAFPFIRRALESVSPSDFHTHLDATHDTLPEITRSLGVWARCPLLEKHTALGLGVEKHTYELSVATWGVTQPATRDAVLVASMVYGDTVKNAHMVPFGGTGIHASLQGRGGWGKSRPSVASAIASSAMDSLNTMSAAAAGLLPAVRTALSGLSYPRAYVEWMAAEAAVSAVHGGVLTDDVLAGISLALELVPHFTVDGEPVTDLLDAALDEWLRPLYRVGSTWAQIRVYEQDLITVFAR